MPANCRAKLIASPALLPERRVLLRGLVVSIGLQGAARSLGIGVATLGRAADPYVLLPQTTIRRLETAIDRVCA